MSYCRRFAQIALSQEPLDNGHYGLLRLSCDQWSCPDCADRLRRKWRGFLAVKLTQVSDVWYMITLTAPATKRGPMESVKTLQAGLTNLLKRARRVWRDIQYVRVYEAHKSRAAHVHMLVSGLTDKIFWHVGRTGKRVMKNALSPAWRESKAIAAARAGTMSLKRWWKDSAYDCGMGYMADVQKADTMKAVRYVTKYLTKEAQVVHVKGLRHVQTSRGVGSPPEKKTDTLWTIRTFALDMPHYRARGLYDMDKRMLVPDSHWKTADVYPHPDEYHVD